MKDNDKKSLIELITLLLTWAVILTIVFVGMASCRTVKPQPVIEPPVEQHNSETTSGSKDSSHVMVIHEREVRDSTIVIINDSVHKIEHWHYERDYKYEEYLRHIIDSLIKLKQDSVPYPVYVDKPIPAELKKYQKALIWAGAVETPVIIAIAYLNIRYRRRRKGIS